VGTGGTGRDNRKAARVLGFQPQCSDIDTIVATAWRWHMSMRQRRPESTQKVTVGRSSRMMRGRSDDAGAGDRRRQIISGPPWRTICASSLPT
jgi:hypothetical protein